MRFGRAAPDIDDPYVAVLAITACFLPTMATVLALAIYIPSTGPDNWPSRWIGPVGGALVAIVIWLVVAGAGRRFAEARFANPDEYGQLRNRLELATVRQSGVRARVEPNGTDAEQQARHLARTEALQFIGKVTSDLGGRGFRFLSGSGYINTWASLHRAEEALLVADSATMAVNEGLYDELRLAGSEIPHADDLLEKLRHAVTTLSPSSAPYLMHQQQAKADATTRARTDPCAPAGECLMAVNVLRTVRRSINEYRDELWDGLVRARNQLLKTMAVTSLTVFLLVLFLMLRGAGTKLLEAAALFFLFGAVVGLVSRLRAESQSHKAVDDYGLAATRLLTAPLFSGLAAILGVLVVSLTNVSLDGVTLGPTGARPPNLPPLVDVFDLSKNQVGFLVAALFGLTPGLLIDYLQAETNRFKQGIRNSEATGEAKSTVS